MAKINFYDEQILKIKKTIKRKKISSSTWFVNQELNMPYIPEEYETKFNKLHFDIDRKIKPDAQLVDVSLEEAEETLFKDGSIESIIQLITKIKKLNINKYLNLLLKYLVLPTGNDSAKSIIIFILKENKIDGEFKIVKNNREITFRPSKLIHTDEKENFKWGEAIIDKEFNKEISKLNMAHKIYFTKIFNLEPFPYDKNLIEKTAQNAIAQVNNAFK